LIKNTDVKTPTPAVQLRLHITCPPIKRRQNGAGIDGSLHDVAQSPDNQTQDSLHSGHNSRLGCWKCDRAAMATARMVAEPRSRSTITSHH